MDNRMLNNWFGATPCSRYTCGQKKRVLVDPTEQIPGSYRTVASAIKAAWPDGTVVVGSRALFKDLVFMEVRLKISEDLPAVEGGVEFSQGLTSEEVTWFIMKCSQCGDVSSPVRLDQDLKCPNCRGKPEGK